MYPCYIVQYYRLGRRRMMVGQSNTLLQCYWIQLLGDHTAMHLVDCYSTLQTVNLMKQGWANPLSPQTQELCANASRASIYFQELVKVVKTRYHHHTINLEFQNVPLFSSPTPNTTTTGSHSDITIPKNKAKGIYDATLLVYDHTLYRGRYRFVLQVTLNEVKQAIAVEGFFTHNGLPLRFRNQQDTIMALRVAANIASMIDPYKINIDPLSGDNTIGTVSFIDINFMKLSYRTKSIQNCKEGVRKLWQFVETIECLKVVLLWMHGIKTTVKEDGKLPEQVKGFKQKLLDGEHSLVQLQQSQFLFPLRVWEGSDAKIDWQLKQKRMQETYLHFTQDIMDILGCFVQNPHKIEYQKHHYLRQLSSAKYQEEDLWDYTNDIDSRLQFNVFTNIEICDYKWLNWQVVGKGGFGRVEMAHARLLLLDKEDQRLEREQEGDVYGVEGYEVDEVEEKITRKYDMRRDHPRILREKRVLDCFRGKKHPNITSILNFENDEDMEGTRYLFMIYQENDSLEHYLRRIKDVSLYKRIGMLSQAAKGLLFMHQNGVYHLDFKPNNLLIGSKFLVKICDFGECAIKGEDDRVRARTFPYAPPEVYSKKNLVLSEVDAYAVGVSLYWCIFGEHIWGKIYDKTKFESSLKRGGVPPNILPQKTQSYLLSRVLRILIGLSLRCLKWESEGTHRPSLHQIITILDYCCKYMRDSCYL